MRIESRNLLAEFLLEALDDHVVAEALRCLVHYCKANETLPATWPIERFLAPAPMVIREQVAIILRKHALLTWESAKGSESVSLHATATAEYRAIATKLAQYATVLDTWHVPDMAPGPVSARTIALQKGALLFNHHLFFEVHEILEDQWKQESGDIRLFLQGLIQIAVAFHHLGNRNFRGAIALLHDGLAKITPHQPTFLNVELANFVASLETCLRDLRQLGPDRFQQFPLEVIPPMRFVA